MLGTLATTALLALASPTAAPPHHHRHAVNHRAGCRSSACDKRADAAFARHQRRKRTAELARGWVIPEAIVGCESNFTNEAPNSAGAAGYYQLTEWPSKSAGLPVDHSGYANEHSKAEQDQVAGKLYAEQGTAPWVSSESCWAGRA